MGELNTWQAVQTEVMSRIRNRVWKPGDLIPNEADLAAEFGCARATVNRALRAVAESGFIDRRRKAGTRVAEHPVRKATLEIPIIRHEVQARGQTYGYALIEQTIAAPPAEVRARMTLAPDTTATKVSALHSADGEPFVFEDRWINHAAIPAVSTIDFNQISANEWLVQNAPYSHGDIALSAQNADTDLARRLGAQPGAALFVIDRNTWNGKLSVTSLRLVYAPGFRMRTAI